MASELIPDSTLMERYWFSSAEGRTRVGLSVEFAQTLAGDWVALELAKIGSTIRPRETFGFITTDRATHDLRAPRGFRIVEINCRVTENPQVARLSPLGEGWLLEIEPVETSVWD